MTNKTQIIDLIDFAKGGGLVPAIIQHADTGEVLMLGYMNQAALKKTLDNGFVTFFSRSKNRLWTKGETSGNTLALKAITPDCDRDAILIEAIPAGPTCHLGTPSCFDGNFLGSSQKKLKSDLSFLRSLRELIEGRKKTTSSKSYTARLLQGPLIKIAQKVGEEGVETALAAVAQTDNDFTNEAADLLYHFMVLLSAKNMSLEDITNRLKDRHKEDHELLFPDK